MTTEPYGKKNPFPAPVLSVRHITGEGSPKETIHIEYSLDGSGMNYIAGDALAVIPANDPSLADALIDKLGLSPDSQVPTPEGETASLKDALVHCYDITNVNKALLIKWAAASGSQSVTANPSRNTVTVNGRTYSGKVFVERGRTYVPLRTLTTALGGQVGGAAVTSPGADYNAMDLYWLSRIISAESQGESLTGQIAVGNVVLNRVAASEFPGTIPAVIFDRKHDVQFTPISNGTVYLPPTAQSVEAAKRVLDGENTAGRALYFYAPALSQGVWINANRTYLTIGCHRFYL